MNLHVIGAIFRRNFTSYFSNPTGYVFICVFVLLSSFAAFWPNEFFNANLANLDQLNHYLPYILLVFIPAITMSIWAEERRQGTDELLLTIPAADFDVVLGKYLAAVAIYGVSLLFSLVSNYFVLLSLGDPDFGLLLGTYFGYFVVGMAMLAIGMVASFLTGNLTVGFILGALFNAPLVFAENVPDWLSFLKRLSITEQFRDFSRGVISLASVGYFLSIVALMLYVSIVLIGRRHWRGGQGAQSMVTHYAVRFLALIAVVVSASVFLANHDRWRFDVTSEKLSSLAPQSVEIIRAIKSERPVVIEYFVSPNVPESYVQTRLNLLSTLRELAALNPDKVQVIGHDVDPFSEAATRAEQQFNIRPATVESRVNGVRTREEIFLGVACTSGLDKVVIPFMDKGVPVEYELVRSIATVSDAKRKRLGILTTDAKMFASFDMETMSAGRNELIIDELQKQYEVVQVDPNNPIKERYDALLAVQPSSLGPQQMENFVEAVRAGQPTAIFEDPFPYMVGVPGTMAPKMPPGGNNPFMQQQQMPQPKGDITELWRLLGVDFSGDNVVWQDYNPMPKIGEFITREWVFIDKDSGAKQPFSLKSPISSKLQQMLFLFPGAITGLNSSQLKFTELVSTNDRTGTIRQDQIFERSMMGQPRMNPQLPFLRKPTNDKYVLAAHITGKLKGDGTLEKKTADDEDKPKDTAAATPAASDPEINVVVVSDIDCIFSAFFMIRARGEDPDAEFDFNFDNVPFVLNVLDVLAHDERFLDVRTRRPVHKTLTRVSEATASARDDADKARDKYKKNFEAARDKAQREFDEKIANLNKREGVDPRQAMTELLMAREAGQRSLDTTIAQLKSKQDREIKQAERKSAKEVRDIQDNYKRWAVLLPPIPPLIVGFLVFFNRRAKEREGVSKARLR